MPADLLLIENQSKKPFRGRFFVPGDKSIGQRALIFAAMAEGESVINGVSNAADCLSVVNVLRQLGANIEIKDNRIATVTGWGSKGPAQVDEPLDCGNSGACMRFISGLLAASSGVYVLIGDESLSERPMDRLAAVLEKFGAKVECLGKNNCAPLRITGCFHKDNLEWAKEHNAIKDNCVEIETKSASAQLKTAALLAALSMGNVKLTLTEPLKSRDHSEIMLRKLGFKVKEQNLPDGQHKIIFSANGNKIKGFQYNVYGDPSSAAFLIALAVMKPHSHIVIDHLVINPTRIGFFNILRRMNAKICARFSNYNYGEMVGGITVDYSHLKGVDVRPKDIPLCIDEIPLLAVIASKAYGITRVRGAYQLRQKESDRISMTLRELEKLGVKSKEYEDGFDIIGLRPEEENDISTADKESESCEPITLDAHGDHRLAMSLGVAACIYKRPIKIVGAQCCAVSFPSFWNILRTVSAFKEKSPQEHA